MIGKKLAHYMIESRLGVGGMGEVYLASDTKLGRKVAVKVLPELFARDAERIARFEREAKVLASLNHANIASLHGFEQADETHFLVMELVEGETLAERIARSPVAPDEALTIARQIAEALEAAHEKGVVHRDLKPANVKITPDGKVKVLDFGLAKAMETAPANSNLSNSPTMSVMATNAGVILGTAAYMSPEQARGENIDHRSDIFSFGCVFVEMLTGRQAFQGKTIADIMASVLARDPDLQLLPPKLNPRIHHLLRRAIEKETKRRWQTVADMRAEIELIQSDGVIVEEKTAATSAKPLWKRVLPIALTSLLLSAITGFVVWNLRPSVPVAVMRFPFTLPEGQQFTNTGRTVIAISPDGAQMVYVANTRLYLRNMSELESRPIPGTEFTQGVLAPVFSPDGQSLAFFTLADNTFKRIAVSGGAAVTICAATNPSGVSWYKDSIIYGQGRGGILRVSANGGKPEVLVSFNEGTQELADTPQMLPDGDNLLFTIAQVRILGSERWDKSQIVVQSLKTGNRKTLIEGGSDGRYLPTGHIVYAFSGTMRAVPFDLRRLEVRGGPTPILEGVMRAGGTGGANFSFSDSGLLIYVPGPASLSSNNQLLLGLVDRNGAVEKLKLPPGPYEFPRISPDGKRLAFELNDGKETNIWIYELSGASSMQRLTTGGSNRYPVWSGNGQRIVFQSNREGDSGLFWQRSDGSNTAERLTKPDAGVEQVPTSWPQGSQWFLFHLSGGSGRLWTFSIQDKKAIPIVAGATGNQSRSAASADGRWLAYQSNETGGSGMGGNEIWVQPYPTTGAKYQITRTGANDPLWSPDGKELFYYIGPPQRLMAVGIKTQPSFSFTEPVRLPLPVFVQGGQGTQRNFDITPDGKRFVMVFSPDKVEPQSESKPEIRIVLNWLEELKQRVPTGK